MGVVTWMALERQQSGTRWHRLVPEYCSLTCSDISSVISRDVRGKVSDATLTGRQSRTFLSVVQNNGGYAPIAFASQIDVVLALSQVDTITRL